MRRDRSDELWRMANEHFVGGVNSPVRAFKSVGCAPVFIEKGEGAYIVDVDGNRYIDYVCSWGPLILGHAHPEIVRAVCEAAGRGTSYGACHELEIELAKRVKERFPSVELLRLVNSGTEATMSAIRLARGYTERELIVKFEGGYHGHADSFLSKAGSGLATFGVPDSAGVVKDAAAKTLNVPYNDISSVERSFERFGEEIAAVIVEPIAGNMGVVPPEGGFLEGLRELCDRFGSLLIFDEVITGFRVARGGAQELFGVVPDMTILGKILGGGLPIGAYGGRRKVMSLLAPEGGVYQAGTLSGNPLACAAGIATLDLLTDELYRSLESLSAELEAALSASLAERGVRHVINRVGSMLTLFFGVERVADYGDARNADVDMFARYFNAMLERGVYLAPSAFECAFVSAAHTKREIEKTLAAHEEALAAI